MAREIELLLEASEGDDERGARRRGGRLSELAVELRRAFEAGAPWAR